MEPQRGSLLVATPQLEDPNFRRSVVLMIEHGFEGSLGVVLNRPSTTSLDGVLPGWALTTGSPSRIFSGGPVQPDALLALAPTSTAWVGSTQVTEQIAMLDLEADIDPDQIDATSVRYFIGYSGWSPGQLGFEIEEGAWWTFESTDDVLLLDPMDCWSRVLARQKSAARFLAVHPEQAHLN